MQRTICLRSPSPRWLGPARQSTEVVRGYGFILSIVGGTAERRASRCSPPFHFVIYSYSYSYSMAINTAHPGYGLSCCHGSLLQIRLTGYKREECVASQPAHEVVHTSLQHEQSSPQLQLLGATGWDQFP